MSSRRKRGERAPARDAQTGQFEALSPFNDAHLLAYIVDACRALEQTEKLMAQLSVSFARPGEGQDKMTSKGCAMVGGFIAVMRDVLMRELQADAESLKEAKKARVEARYLGCPTLAQQRHVVGIIERWQQLPSVVDRFMNWSSDAPMVPRGERLK